MDKDMIKASLARLLDADRITQEAYDKAIDKLDNPTPVVEQDVIDDIVREASA